MVLLRAIYGILVASLLWYHNLKKYLKYIEFVLNKYDHCVENSMVNEKQHTVLSCVDNILSSHVNQKVNKKLLKMFNRNYSKLKNVLLVKESYMSIWE